MTILMLICLIGVVFLAFSFATWWQPTEFRLTGTSDEWRRVRLILFVLIVLAMPAYLVWEWYRLPQLPSNLAAYQYKRKLWSDLWGAIAVGLGLLFGVRR